MVIHKFNYTNMNPLTLKLLTHITSKCHLREVSWVIYVFWHKTTRTMYLGRLLSGGPNLFNEKNWHEYYIYSLVDVKRAWKFMPRIEHEIWLIEFHLKLLGPAKFSLFIKFSPLSVKTSILFLIVHNISISYFKNKHIWYVGFLISYKFSHHIIRTNILYIHNFLLFIKL